MKPIFSIDKECRITGHPDFNLSRCRKCRDSADPRYKDCLTKIVTNLNSVCQQPKPSDIPDDGLKRR